MKTLNKCIAGLIALSIIGLYPPGASFGAGSGWFAKADKKTITRHEPVIRSAPAEAIPMEKVEEGEKKGLNWLWIGVGAAVVAGLVAAGGGGGGGGGPEAPNEPAGGSGSVTVGW